MLCLPIFNGQRDVIGVAQLINKVSFIITVWKFQNFPITQIFREINLGESQNSKTAVFAFFEVLDFVNLVNFSLQKVQDFIQSKIHNL